MSTTTTTTVPEPTPAEISDNNQNVITIDGRAVTPTITRNANQLKVTAGPLDATIRATDANGNTLPLAADGRLQTPPGTSIEITTSGFTIDAPIDIWLFSTPTRLGTFSTSQSGTATTLVALPNSVDAGDHRLVIDGTVRASNRATITIGITVPGETSPWRSIPIWIPVTIAIALALAIPTRWQQRRRVTTPD